jgi:hypothetical protein
MTALRKVVSAANKLVDGFDQCWLLLRSAALRRLADFAKRLSEFVDGFGCVSPSP